ncbi:SinI family autotransporter-associated protein, partial [Salmonella enterica subsp. enterica serovar Kentucky]|nr:SinI family autotransporter-associated protein [Salmonella enterica subsp. enterica serovar Kentucky]
MQATVKRRLTKVALALVVAGYCAAPAVAANGNLKSGQWQIVSEQTGTIQGTVPWITRAADKTADTDKDHVTVTIDRGDRTVVTEGDKQFHVGDKVTVNWAIGDTEGDLDANNAATKQTVQWMRYSDQNGSNPEEIGTKGSDTYEIQASDADHYIGIKITPTTTTGDPAVATELLLKDLSTDAGGGSDDDEIPEGPVVDENVHVVIHEKDSNTNLLKNTGTTLKTNTT